MFRNCLVSAAYSILFECLPPPVGCFDFDIIETSTQTLLYVYKSLNGLCPRYIDACLTVKRLCEGSVKTRTDHGLNLRVPRSNKCAGDRAFSVAASLKWNTIPIHIRSAPFVVLLFCFLRFVSLGKGALEMPFIIIIIIYITYLKLPLHIFKQKQRLHAPNLVSNYSSFPF